MPIAMDTLAEPKTLPTTVGIVEKNPPFEIPLMMTKTIIGPRVVEAGQMTNMLMAVRLSEMKSVLSGPSLSHRMPQPILPTADAKLKPATRPAPVLEDSPIDLEYRGRKNGGTNRGNVPNAPDRKMKMNVNDLNNRLQCGVSDVR